MSIKESFSYNGKEEKGGIERSEEQIRPFEDLITDFKNKEKFFIDKNDGLALIVFDSDFIRSIKDFESFDKKNLKVNIDKYNSTNELVKINLEDLNNYIVNLRQLFGGKLDTGIFDYTLEFIIEDFDENYLAIQKVLDIMSNEIECIPIEDEGIVENISDTSTDLVLNNTIGKGEEIHSVINNESQNIVNHTNKMIAKTTNEFKKLNINRNERLGKNESLKDAGLSALNEIELIVNEFYDGVNILSEKDFNKLGFNFSYDDACKLKDEFNNSKKSYDDIKKFEKIDGNKGALEFISKITGTEQMNEGGNNTYKKAISLIESANDFIDKYKNGEENLKKDANNISQLIGCQRTFNSMVNFIDKFNHVDKKNTDELMLQFFDEVNKSEVIEYNLEEGKNDSKILESIAILKDVLPEENFHISEGKKIIEEIERFEDDVFDLDNFCNDIFSGQSNDEIALAENMQIGKNEDGNENEGENNIIEFKELEGNQSHNIDDVEHIEVSDK